MALLSWGWGQPSLGLCLELMPNDYLENSFKLQSQAFSLLFLGEIRMSVTVWKNAQSLQNATLKERTLPREKKNKAGCKWDQRFTTLVTAFISSEASSLPHPLLPWKHLAMINGAVGHSEETLGVTNAPSTVPEISSAAPL